MEQSGGGSTGDGPTVARRRVVVVTGAATGIGAAVAEACARTGAVVVTMDPGVALDGSPTRADGPSTADRIVAAGGVARASAVSVTDAPAVSDLFTGLAAEFGTLDGVVNAAGISRTTGFASGAEDDWAAVIDVHLGGYLSVLAAALPIMERQGHGRILGVTSGSGWRAADAGAYGCAKRAVATLTWQVARAAPPGVTVNAVSPIAATRMVAHARSSQRAAGNTSGASAATGGVVLTAAPPPEHLGPIAAHLVSDAFAWCTGAVLFTNGSEVSPVAPSRPIEVVDLGGSPAVDRSSDRLLDRVIPTVLVPAEAAQTGGGAGMPRLGPDPTAAAEPVGSSGVRRCLLVADDPVGGDAARAALVARGVDVTVGAAAAGFAPAAATVDAAAPVDAVVVMTGPAPASSGSGWRGVLAGHAEAGDAIRRDAAWFRAAADLAARTDRAVRVVLAIDATGPGGRSRAQAAAQLSRAARPATGGRVDACVVAVGAAGSATAGALAAALVNTADLAPLSGAELFVEADRVGLASHPAVRGTVTFAGPQPPSWLDDALREMLRPEG